MAISRSTSSLAILAPSSWRAANAAMCQSRKWSGNESRTAMPQHSASTPVPHTSGSRSHTGGSPSSTCTWSSENGRKRTSQSRPARRPGDHRLVAVAGEGAAVVEAHGELVGHGTSKRCGLAANRGSVDIIPCIGAGLRDAALSHESAERAPEHEAERGAGGDVGGVVQAHVDAGRRDCGRERVPTGPAAEQRRRAERRGRVPRGKRARDRTVQPVD